MSEINEMVTSIRYLQIGVSEALRSYGCNRLHIEGGEGGYEVPLDEQTKVIYLKIFLHTPWFTHIVSLN